MLTTRGRGADDDDDNDAGDDDDDNDAGDDDDEDEDGGRNERLAALDTVDAYAGDVAPMRPAATKTCASE